jgi:uncharacterized membrane protein YoaK (UPF0700 family)
VSWERHRTLLLGVTGAAGAIDALSFVHLGKVFTSFMSGNVLFLGLGAGDGDAGLVIRAGVALAAFFAGAVGGARLVGTHLVPAAPNRGRAALAIEAALLLAFAVVWLAFGAPDHHAAERTVLLGLAGGSMGIQGALVLALRVPNVVTVALTATVAYLGQRAGASSEPKPAGSALPSTGLLIALVLMYVVCAFVVAVLPSTPALSLAPLLALLAAVAFDRQTAARTARAASTAAA